MSADFRVVDFEGREIVLGTHLLYGADDEHCVVVEIVEADVDYDDELERPVEYPVQLIVESTRTELPWRERIGTSNVSSYATWFDRAERTYEAHEDVRVADPPHPPFSTEVPTHSKEVH